MLNSPQKAENFRYVDDFINQADAESAELQAVVSAIMQKLQEKGVEYVDRN